MTMIFKIPHCPIEGCLYNKKKRCMLDKMQMHRFKGELVLNHNSDNCRAKQQLNEHKLLKIVSGGKK